MSSIRQREGFAAFNKEFEQEREQAELKRTAPIRAEMRRNAELREQLNTAALNLLLSQSSDELVKHCPEFSPSKEENLTAEAVTAAIGEAWNTFRLAMEAEGVKIEAPAQLKFKRILELNRSIDCRKPEAFFTIYKTIDALDGWKDREVTKITQPAKPPVAPEPVDIEDIDTSTRDGAAKARALVSEAVFGENGENRQIWNEWLDSLAKSFNFHPNAEQQKLAIDVFIKNNLNFRRHEDYNVVRRHLTKAGLWPAGMLTQEEILCADIERSDKSLDSYSQRVEFAGKIRAVHSA